MSDAVSRLNAALEGRYAIERELGEGGMATVYDVLGMGQLRCGATAWQAKIWPYISSHQVPPTGLKWLNRLPAQKALQWSY